MPKDSCKTCKHVITEHFDARWFNAKRAIFGYIPTKKERKMKAGRCAIPHCKCKEFI